MAPSDGHHAEAAPAKPNVRASKSKSRSQSQSQSNRDRHDLPLGHEKLDVYRLVIGYVAQVRRCNVPPFKKCWLSAKPWTRRTDFDRDTDFDFDTDFACFCSVPKG
jgi:hypothetical protein